MNTVDCIATKLDIREFSNDSVPPNVISTILKSARYSGSGLNTQHWRFIVIKEKNNIKKLSEDSTSGQWIVGANFAIILLTDPNYGFHLLDAGRVIQNMQLSAWDNGVGSGIYTGIKDDKMRNDFKIPLNLSISAVVGFGYPRKSITGKRKNRKPINELAFNEIYGNTESVTQ
ncbi:MAG TPA: nitroreductase family protein [Candidatus Nitrosocosmicus sp.]|nr:nitroreductase family protein [Candidatus Nitrosocosmicus sp.]